MYSLVGVNGNAYSIIGYVMRALHAQGLHAEADTYIKESTAGDYQNLLIVSLTYLDKANDAQRRGEQ